MSINKKINRNPDKLCDIIMKGGITSGIVYPKAIFELAKSYKFCSIGGTSAGAIASGLTAAAEYRRKMGSNEGFEKLKNLPEDLTEKVNGKTRLLSLFTPNEKTKKYYNTLLPFLYEKGKWKKFIYGFVAVLKSYLFITILFLMFFGFTEYFISKSAECWFIISSSVLLFLCSVTFSVITNTYLFLRKMNRDIKENNFGLTKGLLSEKEKTKNKTIPLTEWLADLIDDVAEKKDNEPLTFGDLYDYDKEEGINLKMVTTNLNQGIPKTLPFVKEKIYFFKESEFKEYFPERIVKWMTDNSLDSGQGFRFLPDAEKFPVIVGVRMSLSFPVLISAIPLYVKKYNKDKSEEFLKCWFSDGGICSNFPVHFFDSPLPTRPTFAINLKPTDKADKDQRKNIWMPKNNKEGLEYEWYKTEGSLMSFISSITKTMQNWNDNTQLRIPGFRDRICNILLTGEEGGLNLNMDEKFIGNICERGKYAGIEFVERFDVENNHVMNWENHKWIRLRTTLALLQKYLMDVERVYDNYPHKEEQDYKDLLSREENVNPTSYPIEKKQKDFIIDELKKICDIVKVWDIKDKVNTFSGENVPRPQPELRIKPRM